MGFNAGTISVWNYWLLPFFYCLWPTTRVISAFQISYGSLWVCRKSLNIPFLHTSLKYRTRKLFQFLSS